jgi:hypothetical protein
MNHNEQLERLIIFTLADCVELTKIIGYVNFMEAFHTALLVKKNSMPLSQDELQESQKELWNDWTH